MRIVARQRRRRPSSTPWSPTSSPTRPGAPRSRSSAPRRPRRSAATTDGPGYAAARQALEEAFGKPVGEAGSGGSIPLLRTLQQAVTEVPSSSSGDPRTPPLARIHASDESVDPTEIEKLVVAQALLLQLLAEPR